MFDLCIFCHNPVDYKFKEGLDCFSVLVTAIFPAQPDTVLHNWLSIDSFKNKWSTLKSLAQCQYVKCIRTFLKKDGLKGGEREMSSFTYPDLSHWLNTHVKILTRKMKIRLCSSSEKPGFRHNFVSSPVRVDG